MAWRVFTENLINFNTIGFRLYVGRDDGDGRFSLLTKPTMKTLDSGAFMPGEDAFLDDGTNIYSPNVRSFLQAMSDAAWEIGIKPKQIEDHSNELKATKYHLEDMRKLSLTLALGESSEKISIGDVIAASGLEQSRCG